MIEEIMQADFSVAKSRQKMQKRSIFPESEKWQQASGHTENTENMVQRLQEKSTGSSGKKSTGTAKSHKNSNSIQNSFGTDCSCSLYFQQYVSQIRHLQRTSLWLEMYLSSSVIPWDFMVIIRNMQSS